MASRLLREVMGLFHDGTLSPLPYHVFPAARVVEAFRHMQQSRHIGKVVIDLEDANVVAVRPQPVLQPLRFDAEATYLVTGGIEGFGLESSIWLAEHGAGHIVLISRRGMKTPGAADAITRIEALGAQVHVFSCDVTDRAALEAVFAEMERKLPPLRGVLHAAMVLDDGLLSNLNAERFDKVLAPKLRGAWHLHNLTLSKPLDYFIMYSSVTTSIGNPGQANYVAANAYLESLSAWRRAHGLPATCICWGPISDAGCLSRNTAVKDKLAACLGAEPTGARQALSILDRLLTENCSQTTVADFDWLVLSRTLPSSHVPRFEMLRHMAGSISSSDEASIDIQALITGKSIEEIRQIVQTLVTTEIAQILCTNPDRIEPTRSLNDLGMDSLMAVELAIGIEKRFGIELPVMLISEGPSVERISTRLAEQLGGSAEVSGRDDLSAIVSAIAIQHAAGYSIDEVAQTVADIEQAVQAGASLNS